MPDDLELPREFCQPVQLVAGFSLPRAADFVDAPSERFTRVELVDEETDAVWTAWRTAPDPVRVTPPVFPPSRIYTHSAAGTASVHRILEEGRPLRGNDDEYVLVFAFQSWKTFEGWFGDAGELDVWMRANDLAAGSIEHAWGMIRTD